MQIDTIVLRTKYIEELSNLEQKTERVNSILQSLDTLEKVAPVNQLRTKRKTAKLSGHGSQSSAIVDVLRNGPKTAGQVFSTLKADGYKVNKKTGASGIATLMAGLARRGRLNRVQPGLYIAAPGA